jgi:hypothetical protein
MRNAGDLAMTSVNAGLNSYAQYGLLFAQTQAQTAAAPSLVTALANDGATTSPGGLNSNAATNLTLSDAALAQLAAAATQSASASTQPDFTTVTNDTRSALDKLYADANVSGPLGDDGKKTVDLSKFDRRSLFAISTNSGGKFTPDEQAVANDELKNRFNTALAPSLSTTRLTGDYGVTYKSALDYLDAASPEEKATTTWAAQRAAVLKGYQATQQDPTKQPPAVAGDPVAPLLSKDAPDPSTESTRDFSDVADDVRAFLDKQKADAASNHTELVFDPNRKFGQLANLKPLDNRSLSAITLNEGNQFSSEEIFAAKTELNARTRASVLDALKQSQSSGDPRQLSLGILNSYAAKSPEELQAINWTPDFQKQALQNYKTATSLLSALQQ